jgi:hypothetical protein
MYKHHGPALSINNLHHQRGQALIYGLFTLIGGLAALFFLFNTGQLTAEKSKLVNTADAVAYSAGVMHARALNFDAYTNRALMANEVMIAQAVSIASWSSHVVRHTENIPPLMCQSSYSRPVVLLLVTYIPVCYMLSFGPASAIAQSTHAAVSLAASGTIGLSETAKRALQSAQTLMKATLIPARGAVMQAVADANYLGDGVVHVDEVPLADDFLGFSELYSENDRTRFKSAVTQAADLDGFVKKRSWTSKNSFPCILGLKAEFRRRGGTELIGFDEWKAMDTASLHEWHWKIPAFGLPKCEHDEMALGYGTQSATHGNPDDSGAEYGNSRNDNPGASADGDANGRSVQYSGVPRFYDLSASQLAMPSPALRFSIRLTREKSQTRTSEGLSVIKPTGKLALYDGHRKCSLNVQHPAATTRRNWQVCSTRSGRFAWRLRRQRISPRRWQEGGHNEQLILCRQANGSRT